MSLAEYTADFHIHSLLSPCAEVEMTPRNLIRHAVQFGINLLAITDHNACDNVEAALKAAENTSVTVLPGMEVETKEEVHVVVLFDTLEQMKEWEKIVAVSRSGLKNDEQRFGAQFVVDSEDQFLYSKSEMLLSSLVLDLATVTKVVSDLGGLCIASHVDRPMYSVLAQLGFIPENVHFSALEISRRMTIEEARTKFKGIDSFPCIQSSDAHRMEEFITGPKTVFKLAKPCLSEIKMAFHGIQERTMTCYKGGTV